MQEAVCTKCGAHYESAARFCGFDRAELVRKEIEQSSAQTLIAKSCMRCLRRYPNQSQYCAVDGTELTPLQRQLPSGPKPLQPQLQAPAPKQPTTAAQLEETGTVRTYAPAPSESLLKTGRVESGSADSEPNSLVGKNLDGKYMIDSHFAEGGMAELYLAHHMGMERTVVVKVVHEAMANKPEVLERFERECKLVGRLNHPNIVSVYDFGFIDGKQPYLVMEYIRGMPLSDRIEKQGLPPILGTARIISQVCLALEEAHSHGIIHRDLKPENILLQEKVERPDWVKLVDFGIAHVLGNADKRLTRTGRIIGTPEYMSPEQIADKPLDARSDIYSMGLIAFELLTGRGPFDPEDLGVLMSMHLLEKPPPVSQFSTKVKRGSKIEDLVAKCLEKEPNNRFQTVTELHDAVQVAFYEDK
jgi:eukaryotic-like serine/threonine-protein kinase